MMKYIKAIIGILLLIGLDQWTKYMAVFHLKDQNPINLIGDAFQLFYLENKGAAFGLLQNKQTFFFVITIIVLVGIGFMYYKVPNEKKYNWLKICMVLIISGAIGNMIDRVMNQYVVDFFYFKLINFPVFNVADCYVTVAVAILTVLLLFVYKEEDLNFFSIKVKDKDKLKDKEEVK